MRITIINSIKVGLMVLPLSLLGCIVDQGSEANPVSYPTPDFDVPATGTPEVPPPDEPEDDPPVSIQNQKIEVVSPNPTKDSTISLKVIGLGWPWMKIGFDTMCNDGEWEIFSNQKVLTIPPSQMNKEISLSVMFSDLDTNDSICYVTSVRHDNKGPEIILKRYPAPSIEEGVAPEIEYQISDISGVATAGCSLNGASKVCPAGGPHVVTITQLPEGSYDFALTATDALGNTSQTHVPWEVVNKYRSLTQKYEIKDQRKVDILMVIDNSGSMAYEQKNMAQRTSNLLSVIRGLDWQIGVTTTDPRSGVNYGDGQLVKFDNYKNATYVINSSMPEAEAQKNLADTLQRSETGSGSEQGIYATYRALERSQASGAASPLIRQNAQFASVVITDEDESANGAKNDPHNLIKFIGDTFGGAKNFSFHSIILKPGDKNCPEGATAGNRYKTLSDLTGGVLGSVCEQDYSQQVIGIANGIRNLLKTLTLECEPVIARGISITKDGAPFSVSYSVEGVNLKFVDELSEGQYAVSYACLK
jgi:hypothetical protein